MMTWLYRRLLAWHPRAVREEFGAEMLGVFLEARETARSEGRAAYVRFCAREVGGALRGIGGGFMEGNGTFFARYRRWLVAGTVAGALAGLGWTWNAAHTGYTSSGLLVVLPPQIPAAVVAGEPITRQDLNRAMQAVLSRASLSNQIQSLGLYLPERGRMPMEDVIEEMRKAIHIQTRGEAPAWEVSFRYQERKLAQKATQQLLTSIVDEVQRERAAQPSLLVDFLRDKSEQAAREMDAVLTALREARQQGGSSNRPTDRLELDAQMARQHYESLRQRHAEARMRHSVEERRQGPLLQILDHVSLPQAPLAREFFPWSLAGGGGLGAGGAGGVGAGGSLGDGGGGVRTAERGSGAGSSAVAFHGAGRLVA